VSSSHLLKKLQHVWTAEPHNSKLCSVYLRLCEQFFWLMGSHDSFVKWEHTVSSLGRTGEPTVSNALFEFCETQEEGIWSSEQILWKCQWMLKEGNSQCTGAVIQVFRRLSILRIVDGVHCFLAQKRIRRRSRHYVVAFVWHIYQRIKRMDIHTPLRLPWYIGCGLCACR